MLLRAYELRVTASLRSLLVQPIRPCSRTTGYRRWDPLLWQGRFCCNSLFWPQSYQGFCMCLNYGLRTRCNLLHCNAFGGVHEPQVTALETPCYNRADFTKNRAKCILRPFTTQGFSVSITRGLANPLQRKVSVARVASTSVMPCSAVLFVTCCSYTLKPLAAQCF